MGDIALEFKTGLNQCLAGESGVMLSLACNVKAYCSTGGASTPLANLDLNVGSSMMKLRVKVFHLSNAYLTKDRERTTEVPGETPGVG